MNMSNYVIFWYPTLFHTSFHKRPHKREKVEDDDISDTTPLMGENPEYPHLLHIEKTYEGPNTDRNKDKADLLIQTFKKNPTKKGIGGLSKVYDFTLSFENRSNNGFVVYSYDSSKIDFSTDKGKKFLRAVYHQAKQFYHKHEINHTSDSGLRAYVVRDSNFNPEDILKTDHCALQDFLEQYEEIFKCYAVEVSEKNVYYERIIKNEPILLEKVRNGSINKNVEDEIWSFLDDLAQEFHMGQIKKEGSLECIIPKIRKHILQYIREVCEDAMVEYAYASTLLYSKYNTQIRTNIEFSSEELMVLKGFPSTDKEIKKDAVELKDIHRKTAINIKGSVNYLKCIISRCGNRENKEVEELVNKVEKLVDHVGKNGNRNTIIWSILSAIIGVLLGLLLKGV